MATLAGSVVLLSGGLDSAVALAWARAEGLSPAAVTFDYGQRHRHEVAAARRIAEATGTPLRLISIDLRAVGGSALTDDIAVPKGAADEPAAREVPITYVPARNMIFLSIGAGVAEVLGADALVIGVNAVDYSGYPDCRREFIDAFERAAALGTKRGAGGDAVKVLTPLVTMSKEEIIRLGASLGVDFAATHSCYDPSGPGALACGACESCRIRRRGFECAGVPDPTRYAASGAAR